MNEKRIQELLNDSARHCENMGLQLGTRMYHDEDGWCAILHPLPIEIDGKRAEGSFGNIDILGIMGLFDKDSIEDVMMVNDEIWIDGKLDGEKVHVEVWMFTPEGEKIVDRIRSAAKTKFKPTGLRTLDKQLGGGLMPGSLMLLSGPLGVGKSSLAMAIANAYAKDGRIAFYVSSTEANNDCIRALADRAEIYNRGLFLCCRDFNDLEEDIDSLDSVNFIVYDFLQEKPHESLKIADALNQHCKDTKTCALLINTMNKKGEPRGGAQLEDAVDVVMEMGYGQWPHSGTRELIVRKNRYGKSNTNSFWSLTQTGIESEK